MSEKDKKQEFIIVTTLSMTIASKETFLKLLNPPSLEPKQVLYIQYLIQFQEKFVQALIDLNSEVNIINPTSTKKQGLYV